MAESENTLATELFGHIVGLQLAISELNAELGVDTIEENPRTVFLALKGLERQAKELVNKAKREIEKPKAAQT